MSDLSEPSYVWSVTIDDGEPVTASGRHALEAGLIAAEFWAVENTSDVHLIRSIVVRRADSMSDLVGMGAGNIVQTESPYEEAERRQRPDPSLCCGDALFWCPTVEEVECGIHGGFSVCCEHPERHVSIPALVEGVIGTRHPQFCTPGCPPDCGGRGDDDMPDKPPTGGAGDE